MEDTQETKKESQKEGQVTIEKEVEMLWRYLKASEFPKVLEGVSPDARNKFLNEMQTLLTKGLEDRDSQLKGPEEKNNWFEYAKSIHPFLRAEEQKILEKQSIELLAAALKPLSDKNLKTAFTSQEERVGKIATQQKFGLLRSRLNFLQKLSSQQISQEGREQCAQACLTIEKDASLSSQDIESQLQENDSNTSLLRDHALKTPSPVFQVRKEFPLLLSDANAKYIDDVKSTVWTIGLPVSKDATEKQEWMIIPFTDSMFEFRSMTDPGLLFTVDFEDVAKNNAALLKDMAINAYEERKKEGSKEQQEALTKYDLPTDRPAVHLRVVDIARAGDPALEVALSTSSFLSSALSLRYKNFQSTKPVLVYDEEPLEAIEQSLSEIIKQQGRSDIHIFLDVYSHGDKEYVDFGKHKLTSEHLISLATRFPDVTFTVNTIACYGGGLSDIEEKLEQKDDALITDRLAVFTHAKPNSPNVSSNPILGFRSLKTSIGNGLADAYTMNLIRSILAGKKFGEAARDADIDTKEKTKWPTDGEAIIHGKKLSMDTTMKANDQIILSSIEHDIGDATRA